MKTVIIGGVAGGMSTAAKLRRLDKSAEIIVFDRGNEISLGACGLPYYISGDVKDAESLFSRTTEEFQNSGIDIRVFTEVVDVDTEAKVIKALNVKTGRETIEAYDKLVVASGAKPRAFPPFDVEANNLFTIRSVKCVKKIKQMLETGKVKDILIIGGGFIGVEMAEAFKQYKATNVMLLQKDKHILNQFDPEISDELKYELEKNDVKIYAPANLKDLKISLNNITSAIIELSDNETITVNVDLVINATGIKPETDFITGVEKLDNGAIKVNDRMQTTIKDIYAAGDCSVMRSFVTGEYSYTPLGTNANKQGRIIAEDIVGRHEQGFKLIGSAAIRVFEKDAGTIGISELQAKNLGINYKTKTVIENDKAGYMVSEKIKIKIVYHKESKKILGAQIIGKGTIIPRCNYIAVAISAGITTTEFGMIDMAYAPPFSGVWDPTLIAGNIST